MRICGIVEKLLRMTNIAMRSKERVMVADMEHDGLKVAPTHEFNIRILMPQPPFEGALYRSVLSSEQAHDIFCRPRTENPA
jgi:hypothetical protein